MRKYNLKLTLSVLICAFLLTGCVPKPAETVSTESGKENTDAVSGREKEQELVSGDETVVIWEKQKDRPEIEIDENVARDKIGPDPVEYTEEELSKAAGEGGYYFDALDETQQRIYLEIYLALTNREEVILSTLDADMLDKAYQCVMYDHAEIFYSSGYVCTKHTKGDELVNLTFYARYDLEPEVVERRQGLIDAYVKQCLSTMPEGLDEYGQVKYVHDYIIEHTQYDLDAEDNQNICSVFLSGASVCQGYAEATQYLLKKLGFEITLVTGMTAGGSHAWNLVMVDGDYYYLDTTWGDVDYQTAENNAQPLKNMPVNYDYFLITTGQLELTHTINSIVPMPVCVAVADNYYVREGAFFDAVDEGRISGCFQKAHSEGKSTVTLKASDSAVFQQLKEFLLTNQRVFDYVDSSDSVSYYEDERMNTICFWLQR